MRTAYCTLSNFGGLMAFIEEFKERLQIALEKSGLNKRQLAMACRVSAPTVTRWFDKESPVIPDLRKIPTLSRVLGVSSGYLIDGDTSRKSSPPAPSKKIAKVRRLISEASRLLEDDGELPKK